MIKKMVCVTADCCHAFLAWWHAANKRTPRVMPIQAKYLTLISIATVLIRVPRVLMLTQVLVILLAQTPARILPVLPQQVRKALLQYNR